MVIWIRLGSGSMRNRSLMPRCLSLCHPGLATLAAGKIKSVCSISLLASLSFWFLLGCPTSYANGVEHSGMSWGARGCCLLMGHGMKGVHTSDDERDLGRWGHGLGVLGS